MFHPVSAVLFLTALPVINEVMVRPRTGGAEWVEVLNAGDQPVDLSTLSLEDARGRPVRATDRAVELAPGAFVLLASDLAKLAQAHPGLDSTLTFEPPGAWPTLNDSDGGNDYADIVVLRGEGGVRLDSLVYAARWLGSAGISIERVDARGPTLLASNWSQSTHPGGSTPLAENSLSLTAGEADQGALILPPGPVVLDGMSPAAAIGWRVDRPAVLSLEILDLSGRAVRMLKPLQESATVGRLAWDGSDDGGRGVPTGVYWVLLEGRFDGETGTRRWRRPLVVVRGGNRR